MEITKTDYFFGGLVLVILMAGVWVTAIYFNEQKTCNNRGGVFVHEHCFKKDLFLE